MDADQPTSDPVPSTDGLAPPTDRPARTTRGLLGLPMRLSLLTLLAIGAFVAGITIFADARLHDAALEQSRDRGVSAARDAANSFGASMFEGKGEASVGNGVIEDRIRELRRGDSDLVRVEVFVREGRSGVSLRAAQPGADEDAKFADLAERALREEEEVAGSIDAETGRYAAPVRFDDGTARAVVVIEYVSDDAMAIAAETRRKLALGALVGGALLGAIVLFLLNRELFRPLEEMRRVMLQIRSGARGARIGWTRTDELGSVANDFDAMVEELENAQAELAKYVNSDPLTGLLTRDAFTDRFAGELTRARREGYPIALLAVDVDDLEDLNRTHDRDAGDRVLADIGAVIGDCTRPTDTCGRTGGDSFHVALVGADAAQAAVVIERIRREIAQRVGIGPERTRVTCGYGVAEYPSHAVDQIALERMASAACAHAQRDGRDRALAFGPAGGYVEARSLVPEADRSDAPAGTRELSSTVHALARALDGIDPALGGGAHSQRVARYAVAVARELGMPDTQLRELRSAAVLHDVGKVAVPPSILREPEAELDDRQRGALRYHAWVSRTMIAGAGLPGAADIVFHLPENWDGTGYPERLREDAIPMSSRILRAAELLDDLTTGTPWREPLDAFTAAGELKRLAGTKLDPDVAVTLARLVREEGLINDSAATPEGPAAEAA